jgi:hypothetical protein
MRMRTSEKSCLPFHMGNVTKFRWRRELKKFHCRSFTMMMGLSDEDDDDDMVVEEEMMPEDPVDNALEALSSTEEEEDDDFYDDEFSRLITQEPEPKRRKFSDSDDEDDDVSMRSIEADEDDVGEEVDDEFDGAVRLRHHNLVNVNDLHPKGQVKLRIPLRYFRVCLNACLGFFFGSDAFVQTVNLMEQYVETRNIPGLLKHLLGLLQMSHDAAVRGPIFPILSELILQKLVPFGPTQHLPKDKRLQEQLIECINIFREIGMKFMTMVKS